MRKLLWVIVGLSLFASAAGAQEIAFLDSLQHASFNFFWYEANPVNGLIKDRSQGWSPASIASTGFGLSAIGVGVDHGWITRPQGADRVERTLQTFWRGPQGTAVSGMIGYKGLFYHFLDMTTATRTWTCELSSIDTALLLAGILDARQYFDGVDPAEEHIRALADSINGRVDWQWMQNGSQGIAMGWLPESGFSTFGLWFGYNEAMIMYLLAIGSPTYPIPATAWNYWLSGYKWRNHYGYWFVEFPPLFGHQYSHCWVDFRNLQDAYMRFYATYYPDQAYGMTYFENSRRATYAQRAYCTANPGGWTGYSDVMWGLTACDGPDAYPPYHGYIARGAPPAANDDGTIAPTAAAGAIAFAPEIVVPTLQNMWENYPNSRHMYGLRDAFNLTANWWDTDVIGIDQGPIVLMIENYRTESVWDRCMQIPAITLGLSRAGFLPAVDVEGPGPSAGVAIELAQNDPNPFRGATTIRYRLPQAGPVRLTLYDARGRRVAALVDEVRPAGEHVARLEAARLASGVYTYRLEAGGEAVVKKCVHLRP
jgi:hypothetical protein